MQGKVASIVESSLTKIINDLGYELYEVEYAKKQNGMNLTVYIYSKNNPITIQDCEKVHRTIDPILDEINPTNGESYYLNVSSVGLDKPLKSSKDFERCLNQDVIVKLYTQQEGVKDKQIIGTLKGYNEEEISLLANNQVVTIKRNNIALCKLDIKF